MPRQPRPVHRAVLPDAVPSAFAGRWSLVRSKCIPSAPQRFFGVTVEGNRFSYGFTFANRTADCSAVRRRGPDACLSGRCARRQPDRRAVGQYGSERSRCDGDDRRAVQPARRVSRRRRRICRAGGLAVCRPAHGRRRQQLQPAGLWRGQPAAGLAGKAFEVYGFAYNLFDQRYQSWGQSFGPATPTVRVGQGQILGLGSTIRF